MWQVYILRCADGTLYTGSTNDVEKRLAAHNAGRGAKYTRAGGPARWCMWKKRRTKAPRCGGRRPSSV